MTSKARDLTLIGIVALVVVIFAGALFLAGGSQPLSHRGDYEVRALVPSAVSLGDGAEVRMAGVQVGRVTEIRRSGRGADLRLQIEDDQAPIPADSQFSLRLRSLIGENYVEVFPGKSRQSLPDGGVLPVTAQREEYVELEQVLDLLKGDTRQRAQQLLRGTGDGLRGRGAHLNRVLGGAAAVISGAEPILQVLGDDRARVARLVEQVGDITRAIGERGDAVETLSRQGRATANVLAASDDAMRSTLEALPPALVEIRRTSGVLRDVTRGSSPVIADLAKAVDELRPAIARLGPAARQGEQVVTALDAANRPLQGTLTSLRKASGPLARAFPQLGKVLCELNPMVSRLKPYRNEASALLQNLASVTSYYDANGHAGRLLAMVGQYSIAPQPAALNAGFQTLLDAGVLGRDPGVGYNPFPKALEGPRPAEGRGLDGIDDYKTPYERVQADC